MGMLNPRTNKHEAIVEVITADGAPPKKAGDVIFFVLESGDRVGVNEAKKYLDAIKDIRKHAAEARNQIDNDARQQIAKAYDTLVIGNKGGRS